MIKPRAKELLVFTWVGLTLLVILVWLFSYAGWQQLTYRYPASHQARGIGLEISAGLGRLIIYWDTGARVVYPPAGLTHQSGESGDLLHPWQTAFTRHAFAAALLDPTFPQVASGYELRFPLWLPTILLLAVSCWRVPPSMKRYRRRVRGMCEACGYDLRASPDRCPECGMSRSIESDSTVAV